MKNVTLRDIAEKLGCSRSTVSCALQNQPRISKAMTLRVQTVAREMGWKPNALLAKHHSLIRSCAFERELPNLAIVLNQSQQQLAGYSTAAMHLHGARQRAIDLGYSVSVFNLAEKPLSAQRLRIVLRARGVAGLVFVATLGQDSSLPKEYLRIGSDFASSVVGVRYPDPAYHVAIVDLLSIGQLTINALRRAGFERPGAIIPRGVDRPLSWGFGGGIQSGLFELPETDRVPICYVGSEELHIPAASYPQVANWINCERPDVLITTDPLHLKKFQEQAKGSVKRLKICALDYHEGMKTEFGVDQHAAATGAAAVDLVIGQINRNEQGIPEIQRTIQIEGRWVNTKRRQGRGGAELRLNQKADPRLLPVNHTARLGAMTTSGCSVSR